MRMITRFTLPKRGNVMLEVPAGTDFLQAIAHGQDVQLYAIVDQDAKETEKRDIRVLVTDFAELPPRNYEDPDGMVDGFRYLGTVLRGGEYVVHVFEFMNVEPGSAESPLDIPKIVGGEGAPQK